jgi:hypothetical protein
LLSDEEETQLEVAENQRAVWKHTQFKAAQTIAGSSRDRLAGLNTPLPEVKDNIIAARRRIENEWLRVWEEDQMRRIANGQGITPSQTGVGAELAAPSAPPPAARNRRQAGRSRLDEVVERFRWWREPAEPSAEAAFGGTASGASASSRRSARRRNKPDQADAWSDGIFQRRVPGNATAADSGPRRTFLREFIPGSAPPVSGPPPTDPDGPTNGKPYA